LEKERYVKKQGIVGAALLLGTVLSAGLALVRPTALWAQGTPQAKEYLVLATGGQAAPSVDSLGVAFGRLTLSADRRTLAYDILFSGLKGTPTGVHLHRARIGQPGPEVYPLAAPVNGQSKGQVAFNAADEADLNSQSFYLDIHTDQFPDGEIRSQVVAAPVAQAPAEPQVSFAREIQPIFTANCSCHIGSFPQEGLNLGPGQAFANIVNVASGQSPLDFVEPGDPTKSYIIHKLNNTQRTVGGSGVRMPFGGRLTAARIQLIEKWITQGAQNN
jgi:hypothetical protein